MVQIVEELRKAAAEERQRSAAEAERQQQVQDEIHELVLEQLAPAWGGGSMLCQRREVQAAKVRLLPQQDRLGFNGNFARCFAACRGAYISPCDQDDRWHPEKTARLLAACQRHGGAAYCDSTFIDDAGRPLRQQGRARFSELKVMQSDPPALRLLFSNCVSGHALMFPRALLAQVGVVPEGGYFDWAIALAAR